MMYGCHDGSIPKNWRTLSTIVRPSREGHVLLTGVCNSSCNSSNLSDACLVNGFHTCDKVLHISRVHFERKCGTRACWDRLSFLVLLTGISYHQWFSCELKGKQAVISICIDCTCRINGHIRPSLRLLWRDRSAGNADESPSVGRVL